MLLPYRNIVHERPMPSGSTKQHGFRWASVKHQWRGLLLALTIIAVTFVAYSPAITAKYIWDDGTLLYENPLVKARDGLYRFWLTTEAADYWPLWYTTFWLEWRIWGDDPLPYHVMNILLHAMAAVLLWRVLRRLQIGDLGAYLAGMIFAIHPVTVESVAWISERKTVLSMVLYLLSLLTYMRFEERLRSRWYVLSLVAAAAGLLAKTSVVMLPFVLLLLTWYKRGKLTRQAFLWSVPFFLLSLVFGLLTIWFQYHKTISDVIVRPEGLASRIAATGWCVWFYLYKTLLPINLTMIYPRWDVDGQRVLSYVPLG